VYEYKRALTYIVIINLLGDIVNMIRVKIDIFIIDYLTVFG